MVFLTALMVVQPLENFLHFGGHGNGRTDRVGAVQHIVQVLDVQIDFEAGLVVARNHHGGFGVHDGGACQTALDGLKYQFRVNARFLCQR